MGYLYKYNQESSYFTTLNTYLSNNIILMLMKSYDFEYWNSLDSRYTIIAIEAESKLEAIKKFKRLHPHKKYRLLDDLIED